MGLAHSPRIVTDGLVLYYDAGNAKSYPGSGTILTDISGNGNTISVVGGPVYNSTNGGEFEFTGNETDAAAVSSFSSVSQVTVEWWGTSDYPDTGFHAPIIRTSTGNWTDGYGFYQQGTSLTWFVNQWNGNRVQSLSTTSFDYTHWVGTYDLSNIKLYRDGSLVGTTAHTSAISQPTADLDIGHALGLYDWDGKLSNIKIYNRSLTAAEVKQNYDALKGRYSVGFATNPAVAGIVTSGLTLHLDAGDTNSYPGSGTTWTDLSDQDNNGTLTNGPTYSSADGGYLDFDGSNQYVDVGNLGIDFGSLGIWIYLESTITSSTSSMSLLKYNNNLQGGITFGSATSYGSNETLTILQSDNGSGQDYQRTYIRDNINSGWNYIVIQWNGSSYDFYINGQSKTTYDGTGNPGAAEQETISNLQVANTYDSGGTNFNGRISQVSIYNRALTASEVTQNYNALKGRYGL